MNTDTVIKHLLRLLPEGVFRRKGTTIYFKTDWYAFCFSFEKPTGLIYCTALIIPLYMPCECLYYTYGQRIKIGHFTDTSTEDELSQWCQEIADMITIKFLPMFQSVSDPISFWKAINRLTHPFRRWLRHCCSPFNFSLLKLYTALLVKNTNKFKNEIKVCRGHLKKINYLLPHLIQEKENELLELEHIASKNPEAIEQYLYQIAKNTEKILGVR